MPVESPTVPKADTISNKELIKGVCSKAIRMVVATTTIVTPSTIKVNAFKTVCIGILFLNKMVSLEPLICDKTAINIIPKVVTLTPPAVEPGEPPINIRKTENTFEISLSPPRFNVEKPAVLVLTE